MLPRLTLNSYIQAILLPQPTEELGLQVHSTVLGSANFSLKGELLNSSGIDKNKTEKPMSCPSKRLDS